MLEFRNTAGKKIYVRHWVVLNVYEHEDDLYSVWLANGQVQLVTKKMAQRVINAVRRESGEDWKH